MRNDVGKRQARFQLGISGRAPVLMRIPSAKEQREGTCQCKTGKLCVGDSVSGSKWLSPQNGDWSDGANSRLSSETGASNILVLASTGIGNLKLVFRNTHHH